MPDDWTLRWPDDDEADDEGTVTPEHWRAAEVAEAAVELAGLVRRQRGTGLRREDRCRWALRLACGEAPADIAREVGLDAGYVSSQVRWALHQLALVAVDREEWAAYEDSWARWRVYRGYLGEMPTSPVPVAPDGWWR